MVVERGEKLHLLGTGAMVDGIVEDEHVDAIRMSQGIERGMNDGGGKLCREPAPVDSARVHEAVERILAERHGGALEMHLRVDGTLLEHHAENQQEDAKDRDAAKLVCICRTEDATDLIATEKDLHFLGLSSKVCKFLIEQNRVCEEKSVNRIFYDVCKC